ncbi:alpha-glucan family phosphorylase [Maribellus sp. CM-23]|uniref:alpha-glucan family phosphorylase n=1 Tax=Maribellus sp. CM-23 TaxID=2781026 RepID=UPI001F33CE1C|nr:alpha-glucan family phosphorylase [Maribellus sp. CM-23]MCE4566185.1 alpha-glucan family phosphorylase [Maribellus sp. CM-23]
MKTNEVRYIQTPVIEEPVWKKISVESDLPADLEPLRVLSKNLWWVWNTEARELFRYVDPKIWEECEHNPIVLLDKVSYNQLKELTKDEEFLARMHRVYADFNAYLEARKELVGPEVAYFSMEYGLHDSLKIFSGGLGILAGDYLKEASDSKVNLVAMGLLYRYGYFKQTLNLHGEQMANYDAQQFTKIPVRPAVDKDGNWVTVEVEYPGRNLVAHVWQVNVGSVKLYLLDADHEGNSDQDRFVTHHLYGGDNENRLKQEMLLGLGGIKALKKLGYQSDIYHCNEGHAAFIGIERMTGLINEQGLTFAEAKEVVTASTVFTTHTPVPAGHDSFHNDMFRHYMSSFPEKLGLSWEEFDLLGKANPQEDHFNMSYLACNLSQGINGVSMLHGDVSKEVLKNLYKGYLTEELEIGYVTNGVHYPSWTAPEWKALHKKYFGNDFPGNQLDFDVWKNIYNAPDSEIWELRKTLRLKMINYIKQRFASNWIKRHENPKIITEVMGKLNPNVLTIGFARRFATYKRAHLLFRNLDRLAKIVNNPERPVQFIFAGKAHPADKAGQDLIKNIVEVSKRPEFRGKILFVQNYDINLAKMLLQGVDVWMNTPTRPLEASGTSGEKGVMNGTLHFSVLDGWWVEGYRKNAGWALPAERAYDVQDFQDELDAETIYNILEEEVVPAFYNRNHEDVPEKWVGFVKNTISQVAPNFTTGRMIKDYQDRYYNPQFERSAKVNADGFKLAKELAAWKAYVSSKWDGIKVINQDMIEGFTNKLVMGREYPVYVKVDLNGLTAKEVGLELIITEEGENGGLEMFDTWEFEPEDCNNNICTYRYVVRPDHPGAFNYSFRLFPKNENLPHRQDFKYLKWL